VKLLTDLQILGCELHKMRLAAWLHPDPLGSYSAPPDPLAVIKGREAGEGKKGLEIEKGKGRKGSTWGSEFLVTPLCRRWTRARKSCCRQSFTISAINYSGRASELGCIVNLVDRRPSSLSRSKRLPDT